MFTVSGTFETNVGNWWQDVVVVEGSKVDEHPMLNELYFRLVLLKTPAEFFGNKREVLFDENISETSKFKTLDVKGEVLGFVVATASKIYKNFL